MSLEKEEQLLGMIEQISGDAKNKETGSYIKILKGRRNKNYPNPEIAVCVEGLKEYLETSPYGWTDKNGRQWIPIRLKVWSNKEKAAVKETGKSPTQDDDISQEIPF